MIPGSPDTSVLTRTRAIYRDAAAMYRAHVRYIVGSAAVVLVPFAILDGLGILTFETSSTRPLVAIIVALVDFGFLTYNAGQDAKASALVTKIQVLSQQTAKFALESASEQTKRLHRARSAGFNQGGVSD